MKLNILLWFFLDFIGFLCYIGCNIDNFLKGMEWFKYLEFLKEIIVWFLVLEKGFLVLGIEV